MKITLHNGALGASHSAFSQFTLIATLARSYNDGRLIGKICVSTNPIGTNSRVEWEEVDDADAEYRIRRRIEEIREEGDRIMAIHDARTRLWEGLVERATAETRAAEQARTEVE